MLILGLTSLVFSRMVFVFFNDPEGPNLLVVLVAAAIVYFLSLVIYVFNPSAKSLFQSMSLTTFTGLKRLLVMIFIQIIIVTVFYFCLR